MILTYYIISISICAFLITAYDKYLAKNQKSRIPEKTLLSFVFIGGTIGSVLAILTFRHKISKRSFLFKFFGIVIMQFSAIVLYLNN